ncbi:glycoside hydrolase [Clavulina sp. PMI_390]|nr:glycoside hydrolase [Clavulina sp. PMI_390]
MKFLYSLLGIASVASPALAALATTTRYYDGQEGACGCGTSSGAYSWQLGISSGVYTAAGSQSLYDTGGSSWCGAGCGTCYQLTNQGYSACSTCGTGAGSGQTITVMVTNLCPNNGNAQWCPKVGGLNQYGYSAHFDIMSTGLVGGVWDNPVVSYTKVACPTTAANDYKQCVCY